MVEHNEQDDSAGSAEIGTVVDNTDCVAKVEKVFRTKEEAQQALDAMIAKANSVASEPCQIEHNIQQVADGYKLTASFDFSYQVETMIFQFATR